MTAKKNEKSEGHRKRENVEKVPGNVKFSTYHITIYVHVCVCSSELYRCSINDILYSTGRSQFVRTKISMNSHNFELHYLIVL